MSKADYAALIALCAALASAIAGVLVAVATIALARGEAATMAAGAGHDVVPRDEAVSNRWLRRAVQGVS
jgi:hypothetical protein